MRRPHPAPETRTVTDLSTPSSLRRLIEESDHAFAVIEKAVTTLRDRIELIEPGDEDVIEILRAHLLAINSPSDVLKFFSLELLERVEPSRAQEVFLQAVDALARSPIQPERTYPVERAMIKKLGEGQATRALPALAVLAGREVYPLSRTAARAVATLVGSTDQEAITDRLKRDDLPEASRPQELSEGVSRALWPTRRTSSKSSQERRRELTYRNALPSAAGAAALRPEGERGRQRRLSSILRSASRDPHRCGNCDQHDESIKIGHVVPSSRGGTDMPGNLVALCGDCRRKLPRSRQDLFDDDSGPRATELPQLNLF